MKRGREDQRETRTRFDMKRVVENMEEILDPSPYFGPAVEEVPSLKNRLHGGFGGEDEWPFFFWKAVHVQGYRAAVRRATGDERRHYTWRHLAKLWLNVVDAVVERMQDVQNAKAELELAESKLTWLISNLEDQMVAGHFTYGLVPGVPLSGLKRFN